MKIRYEKNLLRQLSPIYHSKKRIVILTIIKLHSDDEHVTYMDKARWYEVMEGVGHECRKHIKTVALCIF